MTWEVVGGWTVADIALEVASLHPAVRGVRLAMMAVKAAKRAKNVAKAANAACHNCTPKDPCNDARRRAEAHRAEVHKRYMELKDNWQTQPYYKVGRPAGTYKHDVAGHRIKFLDHQEQLKKALQDLKDNKCGPPPSGAEHAAGLEYPGKLAGPKGPLP